MEVCFQSLFHVPVSMVLLYYLPLTFAIDVVQGCGSRLQHAGDRRKAGAVKKRGGRPGSFGKQSRPAQAGRFSSRSASRSTRRRLRQQTFNYPTFLLQWMQQSFRNTSEDNVNSRLAYILHEDLCASFEGDTLLAIRAPPQTHLEIPTNEDDQVTIVDLTNFPIRLRFNSVV